MNNKTIDINYFRSRINYDYQCYFIKDLQRDLKNDFGIDANTSEYCPYTLYISYLGNDYHITHNYTIGGYDLFKSVKDEDRNEQIAYTSPNTLVYMIYYLLTDFTGSDIIIGLYDIKNRIAK